MYHSDVVVVMSAPIDGGCRCALEKPQGAVYRYLPKSLVSNGEGLKAVDVIPVIVIVVAVSILSIF